MKLSRRAPAPPWQLALAKPRRPTALPTDVDRDLHRDLHVVAAENRDVAVTDDVADDWLFDANAGPPMMAIAAAEVASTPATRVCSHHTRGHHSTRGIIGQRRPGATMSSHRGGWGSAASDGRRRRIGGTRGVSGSSRYTGSRSADRPRAVLHSGIISTEPYRMAAPAMKFPSARSGTTPSFGVSLLLMCQTTGSMCRWAG